MTTSGIVRMTLAAIQNCLQCDLLTGEDRLDHEVEMVVASDAMSVVLAAHARRGLLITGLANIQSVKTAHVSDLAAIVYIRGVRPAEETEQLAARHGVVLLATRLGMFDCCGILHAQGMRGMI